MPRASTNFFVTVPVQIVNCTPTITSVSPNVWLAGNTYDVTVTGTGFVTDSAAMPACPATIAKASFDGGRGRLGVSNVQVPSPTQITLTLTMPDAIKTEAAEVSLQNVGSTTVTAPADMVDAPQIWWNGNEISLNSTPPPTQTVNIGDEVDLTTAPTEAQLAALPIPVSFASNTWNVGGNNIGAWELGELNEQMTPGFAGTIPTQINNPNTTTFWISQNPSNAISYQFCIPSQTSGPINDCSESAYATFDVEGPDASILASTSLPNAAGYYFVLPPMLHVQCNG